jgi:hypothetical protein
LKNFYLTQCDSDRSAELLKLGTVQTESDGENLGTESRTTAESERTRWE